jgi:hypothetical protein
LAEQTPGLIIGPEGQAPGSEQVAGDRAVCLHVQGAGLQHFAHHTQRERVESEGGGGDGEQFNHPNQKAKIDNVKDRTALAVKKLDEKYRGLGDRLGDLYAGMYGPLCAFKHGNPMVQRHLGTQTLNGATHYSVYPVLDRKAFIAGSWAVETVIRVGWMGLVSFIRDHLADRSGLDDVMPGMNRGFNQLVELRRQIEARQS